MSNAGATDGERDQPRTRRRAAMPAWSRPLAGPFGASILAHAIVAVALASLFGGGGAARPTFDRPPLRATLTTPAQRFVVPQVQPSVEAVTEAARHSVASAEKPAVVPTPNKPRARPVERGSPHGQVSFAVRPLEESPDASVERLIAQLYPEAIRANVEFDTPPTPVYPKAALRDRRQLELVVAVIVHADGRVELAEGTADDPVYTPVIREALAAARARPPEQDGRPRSAWTLLSFLFEFVGER